MAALCVMTMGGGAQLAVEALYDFQNQFAGHIVQGASGFVSKQYLGPLYDGRRNGDALLLAA
jgi:hypothetical protein